MPICVLESHTPLDLVTPGGCVVCCTQVLTHAHIRICIVSLYPPTLLCTSIHTYHIYISADTLPPPFSTPSNFHFPRQKTKPQLPPLKEFLPPLESINLPPLNEFLKSVGLPSWEEMNLPPLSEFMKPVFDPEAVQLPNLLVCWGGGVRVLLVLFWVVYGV